MNYDDLWQLWLESKKQSPPKDYYDVKDKENAPKNYFLKPEEMYALLNSYSPYDLYNKPNIYPEQDIGYPTSAMNIFRRSDELGVPNAIVQASQDPQNKISQLHSIKPIDYSNVPEYAQPFGTQAIYEHEVGHYQDPRLNPYKPYSYPNMGYIARYGLDQPTLMREAPAMVAEEDFWTKIMGLLKEKPKK